MKSKEELFEKLNKWILVALFLVVISFPLPFLLSNIALYGLLGLWLIQIIVTPKEKRIQLTKSSKRILFLFFSLFLWQAISLFYNVNFLEGLKSVEGKLSLVFIPLILLTTAIDRNKMISLFKAYVLSITVASLILILNLIYVYFLTDELIVYHEFTNALGMHAVFFSYYIFFNALLISFLYYNSKTSKVERVIYTISTLLSFVVLVIAASKNVLMVTVLSLLFGYCHSLGTRKFKPKAIGGLLVMIFIGGVIIYQTETVKERVNEISDLSGLDVFNKVRDGVPIDESDVQKFNGTSLRLTLWYLGVKTLNDEDRLIQGLTAGDRKTVMNGVFDETGLNPWYFDYNLHNQFMQTFVEMGLIGLGIYLTLIFLLFLESIKEKNWLLTLFLSAFVIFQMTESVLERNKGIVFFVFIIMLLLKLNSSYNENRNLRN